jgi:hypothetical protein
MGRCYTINHHVKTRKYMGVRVYLNASFDYKAYVHLPGEEFWISGADYFPRPMLRHLLESKSGTNVMISLIILASQKQYF